MSISSTFLGRRLSIMWYYGYITTSKVVCTQRLWETEAQVEHDDQGSIKTGHHSYEHRK